MSNHQFDVFPNPSRRGTDERPYVVVVQSKFLSDVATRVCVPLIAERFLRPIHRLNPAIEILRERFYFHPVEMVTIPVRLLRAPVANLEDQRDRIIGALDLVFLGI
jgi:toxin CcdB